MGLDRQPGVTGALRSPMAGGLSAWDGWRVAEGAQ